VDSEDTGVHPHSPSLSPAPGRHFTASADFQAGERRKLGRNFHPGRREQALALGYILPPFQGGKPAQPRAFTYPQCPAEEMWDTISSDE